MGINLLACYERANNVSVPAPVDKKDPSPLWWWDHLAAQCEFFAQCGFTSLQLPPTLKTQSGSAETGTGYGFAGDWYDIGSKNWQGGVPTRFGSREQLLRLAAVAAANGMDVYLDLVLHHMMNSPSARFPGADGRTMNGRFPPHPDYFCNSGKGEVAHDHVAGDPDFPFGVEYSWEHGGTALRAAATAAIDWHFKTVGARGARLDDTKGMDAGWVHELCTRFADKYMYGEFDDGNTYNVNSWIMNSIFDPDHPGTEGTCCGEDYPLHYVLQGMAAGAGRWDMRQLDHAGLQGVNPGRALTFVENDDTDTDGFATIIWNKALTYSVIMTREGYPQVAFKDFSRDEGCYGAGGLQEPIINAMWVNARLAWGVTINRYKASLFTIDERPGRLLTVLNNDPDSARGAWVQAEFPQGTVLHDYSGHCPDIVVDAGGWVNPWAPPNRNGLGVAYYAPLGQGGPIPVVGRSITQTVFGAEDLDVGPLVRGAWTVAGRIWVQEGTHIELALHAPRAESVTIEVTGPDAKIAGTLAEHAGRVRAARSGWHEIGLRMVEGAAATAPYELVVTYTAPRTIW